MKMKVTMKNYRRAADALLGVRLGSIFLTTGVVKFVFGIGIFTAGLQQQFADKLPIFMVRPFAYALPFVGHLREKSACRRSSTPCAISVTQSANYPDTLAAAPETRMSETKD